ncbi:hypothetical protein OHA37_20765 [Streptomyces sp. NBC_00335]|uniref:hypothetical protein n=1 Tax=unclassified Streptomyces TaxID=2593676 RepID=UPI002250EABB|nr:MULTISPECIES: hypothetical protein [unclassified Streptomyces]MCX5406293.1 hypothetical protein [Streptomyces sp. NBC_00086]
MRLKSSLVATAAALAAILTPLVASPAAAAGTVSDESISTNAYYGRAVIQWRINPYRLDPIALIAEDRATDGYVIGIRLVTGGEIGNRTWAMRTVPTGQTRAEWRTYLEAGWIDYAYFQVCKIKAGSGAIASCHDSKVMHNPFDDSNMS